MLKCVFRLGKFGSVTAFAGFEISGHAGYGTQGNDIVCAAVSSCTMLVCNAITEDLGADAEVTVEDNRITLRLNESSQEAQRLISAFYKHLETLSEDYENIRISVI